MGDDQRPHVDRQVFPESIMQSARTRPDHWEVLGRHGIDSRHSTVATVHLVSGTHKHRIIASDLEIWQINNVFVTMRN